MKTLAQIIKYMKQSEITIILAQKVGIHLVFFFFAYIERNMPERRLMIVLGGYSLPLLLWVSHKNIQRTSGRQDGSKHSLR